MDGASAELRWIWYVRWWMPSWMPNKTVMVSKKRCGRTYGLDAAARCAFERTGPTAALPFVGRKPMRSRSDAMSKLSTGDRSEDRGRTEGRGKVGGREGGEGAAPHLLFVPIDSSSRDSRRPLNRKKRSRLVATLNCLIRLTTYSRLPTAFDPSRRGHHRISTVAMMFFFSHP